MAQAYPAPVDQLLTYGDPRKLRDWPDYLQLGFTQEHIPALIQKEYQFRAKRILPH